MGKYDVFLEKKTQLGTMDGFSPSNVCTLGRAPEGHHVAVCNGCNVGKNERDKMRRRAG